MAVEEVFEQDDSRIFLSCVLEVNGDARAYTDVEVMRRLDMTKESDFQLNKLVAEEERMDPFSLGNILYAEPLERFCGMPANGMRFFKGRDLGVA